MSKFASSSKLLSVDLMSASPNFDRHKTIETILECQICILSVFIICLYLRVEPAAPSMDGLWTKPLTIVS